MTDSQLVPPGAVVVGHDGSPHADLALGSALRFAESFSAPLVVVRVWQYDEGTPAYARVLGSDADTADLAADIRGALVADSAGPVGRHPEVPIEYRAPLGDPATVLTDVSSGARMLVLGSRGLGGLSGLLLGSVTARCLHQATCPVLVVRDGETGEPGQRDAARTAEGEPPAAGTAQLADVPPRSVVVGHDGSAGSDRALEAALDVAGALHAPVAVIRCWTIDDRPPGLLWRDGYVPSFDEASETVRDQLKDQVAPLAQRHPEVEVQSIGTIGDPGETLTRAAADAAILVVGSRGRGGFRSLLLGSVSAYSAHRATCPTLVVPQARASAG